MPLTYPPWLNKLGDRRIFLRFHAEGDIGNAIIRTPGGAFESAYPLCKELETTLDKCSVRDWERVKNPGTKETKFPVWFRKSIPTYIAERFVMFEDSDQTGTCWKRMRDGTLMRDGALMAPLQEVVKDRTWEPCECPSTGKPGVADLDEDYEAHLQTMIGAQVKAPGVFSPGDHVKFKIEYSGSQTRGLVTFVEKLDDMSSSRSLVYVRRVGGDGVPASDTVRHQPEELEHA